MERNARGNGTFGKQKCILLLLLLQQHHWMSSRPSPSQGHASQLFSMGKRYLDPLPGFWSGRQSELNARSTRVPHLLDDRL